MNVRVTQYPRGAPTAHTALYSALAVVSDGQALHIYTRGDDRHHWPGVEIVPRHGDMLLELDEEGGGLCGD